MHPVRRSCGRSCGASRTKRVSGTSFRRIAFSLANFTGGPQEEIVILQFDQESERRAWIGLRWDSKQSVMRAGAVARGHLVDDAGKSSFPIHYGQRVFVGRFGSSDHAAFLVQDDRAMLIAEWNDLGFFGRRVIDERIGAWTFASADELVVPKPLPDGLQSVVARRDSLIGLLDIGTEPMRSTVLQYDESELRLVPAPAFLRGDANFDGEVDLSDAIRLLVTLFQGGATIPCRDAADSDDSGELDISDAIRLLDFLFSGGDELPLPGTLELGIDPTPDALTPCSLERDDR